MGIILFTFAVSEIIDYIRSLYPVPSHLPPGQHDIFIIMNLVR